MDGSDYVRVAAEEFEAARTAAQGKGTFAETASAVRSSMRSAIVCLVRFAVLTARQRRDVTGQLEFPWDPPPRGDNRSAVGRA